MRTRETLGVVWMVGLAAATIFSGGITLLAIFSSLFGVLDSPGLLNAKSGDISVWPAFGYIAVILLLLTLILARELRRRLPR